MLIFHSEGGIAITNVFMWNLLPPSALICRAFLNKKSWAYTSGNDVSKKDWIYLALGSGVGAGVAIFAKWAYKKLKQGRFDKWFSKAEKENLMEALKEFLEINGGKNGKA